MKVKQYKYQPECQNKFCIETMSICDNRKDAETLAETHMMKYGHIVEIFTKMTIEEILMDNIGE